MQRHFEIVDVFAEEAFRGNPLAVVHAADGLSHEEMLAFTRRMNLSETTFLLPPESPEADYHVRIYSPPGELPFAGHPTLGTCHAWLRAGGKPRSPGVVIQECGAGLVQVRQGESGLAFAAPPMRRSGPVDASILPVLSRVTGIPIDSILAAEWVDNGPGWIAVMLESADAVLRANPVLDDDAPNVGLVGPHPAAAPWAWELRGFFRNGAGTTIEDPVTGSLNASVAQWLFASGRATGSYVARQGTALDRNGRIELSQDAAGQVWVGGATRTFVEGSVDL
jgi:PhzF family phenazine biosynthesis protein